MTKTETRNDKLRAAHDKLMDAVAEIVSGDDWKRMLKTASKFHRYSFNNHLMIFLQRPDATVVAGFNRWKSLGRFVKKGEKGVAIFAPCKYRTKLETEEGEGADAAADTWLPSRARLRHLADRRRRSPGPGRGAPQAPRC
jgi:hypothetical protein